MTARAVTRDAGGATEGAAAARLAGLAEELDERLSAVIASIGEPLLGTKGAGMNGAGADPDGADPGEQDELDPDAHLELVARTNLALGRLDLMLGQAVGAARAAGQSWQAIGGVLGTSRQGAQQRFGAAVSAVGEGPDGAGSVKRRVLAPVTAFGEMAALARAGRYGWHSVAFGAFHHVLERDEWEWEHRRSLSWAADRRSLVAKGWQQIGDSFPWSYYARRTARPALRGEVSDEELLGD